MKECDPMELLDLNKQIGIHPWGRSGRIHGSRWRKVSSWGVRNMWKFSSDCFHFLSEMRNKPLEKWQQKSEMRCEIINK